MFEKHDAFLLSPKSDILLRSVDSVNMEDLFEGTAFTNKQIDTLINYNYDKGVYITKSALLSLLRRIKVDTFDGSAIMFFNKDFSFSTEYQEENFLFEVKREFLFS